MPLYLRLPLTIGVTGAMATDLSEGKIYNFWILPLFFSGVLNRFFTGTANISCLCSIFISVILSVSLFFIRAFAAGDAKLIIAVSTFLTLRELAAVLTVSLYIAAVMGIFVLLASGGRIRKIRMAVPIGASLFLLMGGVL